jgi:hypothetical protein
MEIKDIENNNFTYTYKIKKGINKKKGGGVYGGKMDFCWLYGPEITDRMDMWVEKGK